MLKINSYFLTKKQAGDSEGNFTKWISSFLHSNPFTGNTEIHSSSILPLGKNKWRIPRKNWLFSLTEMFSFFFFIGIFGHLKGVYHKIFNLQFFHDSSPSGPLTNRLEYFWTLFQFRRNIRSQSCLRSMQHTSEMISAVCNIPRR